MEVTVFYDVTEYSFVDDNQRFGRTSCLHFQGREVSLTFLPWRETADFPETLAPIRL